VNRISHSWPFLPVTGERLSLGHNIYNTVPTYILFHFIYTWQLFITDKNSQFQDRLYQKSVFFIIVSSFCVLILISTYIIHGVVKLHLGSVWEMASVENNVSIILR
jgi:hypothetical protein